MSHESRIEVERPDAEAPQLARRRALLSGLGKGSAALAALSPLASQAGGTHKVANNSLAGGFGYCSVSGFQSAAISGGTSAAVCSVFAPSHFVKNETLNYSALVGGSGGLNAAALAAALNAKYQTLRGTAVITDSMVSSTLLAPAPAKLMLLGSTGQTLCIQPNGNTGGLALTSQNFPSGVSGLAAFNQVFTTSGGSARLLEVLYEGVSSSTPASGRCYFLAAYLSVYAGRPSTLPVGFDKTYVLNAYTKDADVVSGTPRYNLFKAIAVTA